LQKHFFFLTEIGNADVAEENSVYNYQDGLILLQRGSNKNGPASVGPHIRGSRLRSSSACFEEVDLLLPGTGRSSLVNFSRSMLMFFQR
jgi:1-phosphatidylinositol-4-phosphate 5-kinase